MCWQSVSLLRVIRVACNVWLTVYVNYSLYAWTSTCMIAEQDVSPRHTHAAVHSLLRGTGAAIVPRSSKSAHLKENLLAQTSFSLSRDEMRALGWPHGQLGDEL